RSTVGSAPRPDGLCRVAGPAQRNLSPIRTPMRSGVTADKPENENNGQRNTNRPQQYRAHETLHQKVEEITRAYPRCSLPRLASQFVQGDRGGVGDVEALHRFGYRDESAGLAMFAHQAADAGAFRAQHTRDIARGHGLRQTG